MKVNKFNLKTLPQAVQELNEQVVGIDPETKVLPRLYESDKPLQDRVTILEEGEWELFDTIVFEPENLGQYKTLTKTYPQYAAENTERVKIVAFIDESPDYTFEAEAISPSFDEVSSLSSFNPDDFYLNADLKTGDFESDQTATVTIDPSEVSFYGYLKWRLSILLYRKAKR